MPTRQVKVLFSVFFNILIFINCTTYPPVTEQPKVDYSALYNYSLVQIEKSGNVIPIDILNSRHCIYTDSILTVKITIDHNKILMNLTNNTQNTLSLNWDNMIFVDIDGISQRVIHSGIKFNEKEKPQTPSKIIRLGSLNDILLIADKIRFIEGLYLPARGFLNDPEVNIPSGWYSPAIVKSFCKNSKEELQIFASENIGKKIQFLIPIEVENKHYEYIFILEIIDYDVLTDCPSNLIE